MDCSEHAAVLSELLEAPPCRANLNEPMACASTFLGLANSIDCVGVTERLGLLAEVSSGAVRCEDQGVTSVDAASILKVASLDECEKIRGVLNEVIDAHRAGEAPNLSGCATTVTSTASSTATSTFTTQPHCYDELDPTLCAGMENECTKEPKDLGTFGVFDVAVQCPVLCNTCVGTCNGVRDPADKCARLKPFCETTLNGEKVSELCPGTCDSCPTAKYECGPEVSALSGFFGFNRTFISVPMDAVLTCEKHMSILEELFEGPPCYSGELGNGTCSDISGALVLRNNETGRCTRLAKVISLVADEPDVECLENGLLVAPTERCGAVASILNTMVQAHLMQQHVAAMDVCLTTQTSTATSTASSSQSTSGSSTASVTGSTTVTSSASSTATSAVPLCNGNVDNPACKVFGRHNCNSPVDVIGIDIKLLCPAMCRSCTLTTATSTISSTASSSLSSTLSTSDTTTATSIATTSQTSTGTTSASSSASTSETGSLTTTATSTATSRLLCNGMPDDERCFKFIAIGFSCDGAIQPPGFAMQIECPSTCGTCSSSTATSTISSTDSSSVSSTASNTATTATTTVSSSITTTASTTIRERYGCFATETTEKVYLKVLTTDGVEACRDDTDSLTEALREQCPEVMGSSRLVCTNLAGLQLISTGLSTCASVTRAIANVVHPFTGSQPDVACPDGESFIAVGSLEHCSELADALNLVVQYRASGRQIGIADTCANPTTATSTVTTSATSINPYVESELSCATSSNVGASAQDLLLFESDTGARCVDFVRWLNKMLRGCSEDFGKIVCNDPLSTTASLLKAANPARCDDDRRAMQRALNDFLPRPLSGGNRPLECTTDGFFAFQPATSIKLKSCREVATVLNTAVLLFKAGDYHDCKFTTATSTVTTTVTSTVTSTGTTVPTCYGVPDKQECSELSRDDCKPDSELLGFNVLLQCPALCRACDTTSTSTTTTTLLCNGEPDPPECGRTMQGRCNTILFGVDVNARCPAMCRACPAIAEGPSSDYSYRLTFMPVGTTEAAMDISESAFETAVTDMLAMLRYTDEEASVNQIEVHSRVRVDVEIWFNSESGMVLIESLVKGEQLSMNLDGTEYKGYPYSPMDLIIEPACVLFDSHKYLTVSDKVCANTATKMGLLAAHCPSRESAAARLSCWDISGGQSILAAQSAEQCNAVARSVSAALVSYGVEVDIRCQGKFFVVESECLSSSSSLQRILEVAGTATPFGAACDLSPASQAIDAPVLIEFYFVGDDELRAVASETSQVAVVALQLEVFLASQISMLKPRLNVESIDLTNGKVVVLVAPAPSTDVETASSVAKKLSALITGAGFEFLYRDHKLTTKRKSTTTVLAASTIASTEDQSAGTNSSMSSSTVALLVLFILLLVLVLVIVLVLYLQYRRKHAPAEVAINPIPLSSVSGTPHLQTPPTGPNMTLVTLSREGEPGYGFGLANVKGKTVISRVTPGSVAQGKLAANDEIVTVNGVTAAEMTKHDFIVALKSGMTIQLGVRKKSSSQSPPDTEAGVVSPPPPPRPQRPSQQKAESMAQDTLIKPSESRKPESSGVTPAHETNFAPTLPVNVKDGPVESMVAAAPADEVALPLAKKLSSTSLNSLIERVTTDGVRDAVVHANTEGATVQEVSTDSLGLVSVLLNKPFGMTFNTGPSPGYFITKVKPGSNAAASGQVVSGAEIVSVNGTEVAQMDTTDVSTLFKSASEPVQIVLRNNPVEAGGQSALDKPYTKGTSFSRVQVSIVRPDMSSGFGFGLQWTPTGPQISAVPSDGIAAGNLCVGDTVTSINGADVQRFGPDDLIAIVASALEVEMVVDRAADAKFGLSTTLSRPDKSSGFGFGVKWDIDGARVAAIAAGGIAEGQLAVGDKIVSLNNHRLVDLPQESITAMIATSTTVEVGFERDWSAGKEDGKVAGQDLSDGHGTVQGRLTQLKANEGFTNTPKTQVEQPELVEGATRLRRQSWHDSEQRAAVERYAEETASLEQKKAAAERSAQAKLAKLESELTSTKTKLRDQRDLETMREKLAEENKQQAKAEEAASLQESKRGWQAQFESRRQNAASAGNRPA